VYPQNHFNHANHGSYLTPNPSPSEMERGTTTSKKSQKVKEFSFFLKIILIMQIMVL